ncbi:MAG TPA: YceD family protein [Rhizomicrobium sp.]|jgi:uncharacterized metal-binding protein YceD (DUF177 family)|nr:YceD family protein [Rhizomicrobium sp.]
MTNEQSPPLERFFDLATLSQAGAEIAIMPQADDLVRLAEWAGVEAIKRFDATVKLKKLSPTRFAYAAHFSADIVQACVVTLEPVASHIEKEFTRELHLAAIRASSRFAAIGADLDVTSAADESPEEIESPHFDVAGPVLEEFVLAIDPYPRREGIEFSEPKTQEPKPESPFAVLKRLETGAKGRS